MNHAVNAKLHRLPACPECGAAVEKPCVTFRGGAQAREPHHIREAMARGDLFVVSAEDARKARLLRALHEAAATARRREVVEAAQRELIDGVRREFGLAPAKGGGRGR